MTRCKACGARVVWIRTRSGKRMPCDADTIVYWENPKGSKKVVTPDGDVVSADLKGKPENATGVGYVSHFASCPEADRFRRNV